MNQSLRNPHLDGKSFYLSAGPIGVLLSHGFTATTTEVRLLAKALHDAGYTVAGPLLPGHGATPQEMNRCRWQDWTAALEGVYKRLQADCDRVVIGGESLGGLLALYLASQHPEAAAVLTYAPAIKTTHLWIMKFISPALSLLVKTIPKRQDSPTYADAYWQGYKVNPVPAAVQLFRLQSIVRKRLNRISQPLLVIQGRLDPTVSPEVPEILRQGVSSAITEVHWLENSTHCVILDAEWEQAAQITLRFLERVL
jgi:carboxylesterase